MEQFWQSLELIEKIYLFCAIGGSIALILSIGLQLLGGDFDISSENAQGMDGDTSGMGDSDISFQLLSWLGLSSFFTMFGFVALALSRANELPFLYSFPGGILAGMAHFFFIRFLFKSFQKLQSTGKNSNTK